MFNGKCKSYYKYLASNNVKIAMDIEVPFVKIANQINRISIYILEFHTNVSNLLEDIWV